MVQIFIPYPDQLHAYFTKLAARDADMTRKELLKDYRAWARGETSMPHEVTWETDMAGDLISRCEVLLRAGYSVQSGPWGNFVILLWTAMGARWKVAQQVDTIRDRIQAKGLNARTEVDGMTVHQIHITNANPASATLFSLGHQTPEGAIAHGEDEEHVYSHDTSSLILEPEGDTLLFDIKACVQQLQQFQHIASQTIDALYEAFDLEAPRITILVDMAHPSTTWTAE